MEQHSNFWEISLYRKTLPFVWIKTENLNVPKYLGLEKPLMIY